MYVIFQYNSDEAEEIRCDYLDERYEIKEVVRLRNCQLFEDKKDRRTESGDMMSTMVASELPLPFIITLDCLV